MTFQQSQKSDKNHHLSKMKKDFQLTVYDILINYSLVFARHFELLLTQKEQVSSKVGQSLKRKQAEG